MPEDRTIAQRELRNDIGRVLRAAEAGTNFTITVRGRPVARLGPTEPVGRQVDVPRATLLRILSETPVDEQWLDELLEMRRAAPSARIAWED